MIFLDTETCGLHGVPVIIQYAKDEGEIQIYNFWKNPIQKSLDLINEICSDIVVGFNLAFDWFHINKIYNIFNKWPNKQAIPETIIDELAYLESSARDGLCVKPIGALDLMLHARKTKYQSTMDRKPINIRKVPNVLALPLAQYLEQAIQMSDIYFARRKDKFAPRWVVKERDGEPDFKDVKLDFKASSSLKALAVDALGADQVLKFDEVALEKGMFPVEAPFAPFATAISDSSTGWYTVFKIGKKKKSGKTWPGLLKKHIDHWEYNGPARKYATSDVLYTRGLYHYFGNPDHSDVDSLLACCVAAVRWKGYAIDLEKLKEQRRKALDKVRSVPIAPRAARAYLEQVMTPLEKLVIKGSTKRVILEELEKRVDAEGKLTEVASRAKEILDARKAVKEVELYDKLLLAGRFHFSVVVIGTLSSRMAGTDGLNPQGIKRTKDVRGCFTFADPFFTLVGGDFSGFEVVLAVAVYDDPELKKDLLTCEKCEFHPMEFKDGKQICPSCKGTEGKKIHALFGMSVFPTLSYDDIKRSKGKDVDYYERSKRGVFSQLYGGNADTMSRRVGIPIEDALKGEKRFGQRYQGVARAKKKIFDAFCSMRQPAGIGSKVEWHEPAEKVSSLFGFERYFTLENVICKALFTLANNPPKEWRTLGRTIQVVRRDRVQTAGGAVQSALYGAAFAIQGSNMRAAANHEIQSSGAQVTKDVQCKIWGLQPAGIHPWIVQPCNIHDEILCPTHPEKVSEVTKIVHETVESYRPKVPLILMEWSESMRTWADK